MNITLFQIILTALGTAIIGLYLPPLIKSKTLNEGNIFGYTLGALLIASGLLLGEIISKCKTSRAFFIAAVICIILIAVFLAAFFTTLHIIVMHSKTTDEERSTLIILGCKIRGSTPSKALLNRAKAAAEYMKKHPCAITIASGGQGKHEDLCEAQCIYSILVDEGIDGGRIILEDKSTNTDENIRFSREIINKNALSKDVAIATSDYHQYRASLICKKFGLNACAVSTKSSPLYVPTYFTREVFGVWAEKIMIYRKGDKS